MYCTKCKLTKPLSDFWKNKSRKSGFQGWCKSCHAVVANIALSGDKRDSYLMMRRNNHLKSKYGITAKAYDDILKSQNGLCAICKSDFDISGRRMALDHDHASSKVRGILCGNCNRALGAFKESVSNLKSAIKYIENN